MNDEKLNELSDKHSNAANYCQLSLSDGVVLIELDGQYTVDDLALIIQDVQDYKVVKKREEELGW